MKAALSLLLVLVFSVQGATAQPSRQAASPTSDNVDTVNVDANKIPPSHTIHNFVKSYAQPTLFMGKMARWSAQSPLCPLATGLPPAFNVFVAERIRKVAGLVGAPLQARVPCKPNMVVVFTPHPQELLDAIRTKRTDLLGYHYVAQLDAITRVTHPIQAWYATATRDDIGTLNIDDEQAFEDCVSLNGGGLPGLLACSARSKGTRLIDGIHSEMAAVTVVVDNAKIVGQPLGAVADYTAMLALSQTSAFESCQPLPSITNLMTAGCDAQKAQVLTQADIAYLKGLYSMNPDFIDQLQDAELSNQMEDAFSSSGVGK